MSLPYNAVKRFYSTDIGAPALDGQAGSLIGLLDAILVNGYGTASVNSITRSGSTVTVETAVAHGLQLGAVALIAGADQVDYNGQWIVDGVPDTTHFTFDAGVLTPVSPATGTMTVKRAPVGLTKPFAGTNQAAYQLPAGSTQAFLSVDDTGTTSAAVNMYETMSGVDSGTNPAASGTYVWNKSSTANGTARSWVAYADDRFFWLLVRWHATAGRYQLYCFGDPVPTNSLDAYHNYIMADTAIGGASPGSNGTAMRVELPNGNIGSSITTTLAATRLQRTYNQIGSAVGANRISPMMMVVTTGAGIGVSGTYAVQIGTMGMTYPAPNDNGLYVAPIYITEPNIIRAVLPGMLAPMHVLNSLDGSLIPNVIGLPGRTVQMQLCNTTGTNFANAAFDVTGPWR